MTVTVTKIGHMVAVSRAMLDDVPVNIVAVLQRRFEIGQAQGSRCIAVTASGRRCSRQWHHIAGNRGYCWQHRPRTAPVGEQQ